MSKSKSGLAMATIISYLSLILGNIISLIYTPYMLNKLGEGEYGLFSLTNTIISYIYILDMGFSNAVIRYNAKIMLEKDAEKQKELNGMFLFLYIIISIIGLVIGGMLYGKLSGIFGYGLTFEEISRMKVMFIIAMINLVLAFPLNVFSGIIMAYEKFMYIKVLGLIRTILNPIIMIAILTVGYKAIGMLIASTIFNLLLGGVNIYYCFKILNIRISFKRFDTKLVKEIFKFSFFIFLGIIAQKIYWSTDQIILGVYISSSAIAIYAIASQLNGYFKVFSNVINSMFLPKLTKITSYERGNDKIMELLIKVARIQYIIAMFIFCGYLIIGKEFIIIWVGNEYELAYYIALIIMIPQIISIVQALFATLLEAMNKHKIKSLIYLLVAIVNLILTLVLVKPFGIMGCVLGTFIGLVINAIVNNYYYSRYLGLNLKLFWREILKLVPSTIIVSICGMIIKKYLTVSGYKEIAIFIIIFTIIYIVTINNFMSETEKNIVKKIKDILLKKLKVKEKIKWLKN